MLLVESAFAASDCANGFQGSVTHPIPAPILNKERSLSTAGGPSKLAAGDKVTFRTSSCQNIAITRFRITPNKNGQIKLFPGSGGTFVFTVPESDDWAFNMTANARNQMSVDGTFTLSYSGQPGSAPQPDPKPDPDPTPGPAPASQLEKSKYQKSIQRSLLRAFKKSPELLKILIPVFLDPISESLKRDLERERESQDWRRWEAKKAKKREKQRKKESKILRKFDMALQADEAKLADTQQQLRQAEEKERKFYSNPESPTLKTDKLMNQERRRNLNKIK